MYDTVLTVKRTNQFLEWYSLNQYLKLSFGRGDPRLPMCMKPCLDLLVHIGSHSFCYS